MCPVVFLVFDLEALIGQMYIVVFVLKVIVGGGSPNIAIFVKINTEVVGDSSPDPDVKLTSAVQKWFFDVLLHDPERNGLLFLKDEVRHVLVISKDLDATALVKVGRLY